VQKPQTIDVNRVIEEQRLGGFLVTLMALWTLVMVFDGYDQLSIGFAAPYMIREWHLNRAVFGAVFGIGPFGLLCGGILFSYLADTVGRKPILLTTTGLFSLTTLATVYVHNLSELIVLRFLCGIGLAGMFLVGVAMCLEFVPRRFRATAVIIISIGFSIGASGGGFVSAALIPHHGWPIVFWVGGLAPLVVLAACAWLLPESIRFLAVKRRRPQEIARVVRILQPGIEIAPDASFVASDDEHLAGRTLNAFVLRQLFYGRLAWMTPLLWFCYIMSATGTFFMSSWTPTLAEGLGIKPANAAIATSLFSIGGALASLVLARFVDNFGAIAIAILPLLAAPVIASLGIIHFSDASFIIALFSVGFFMIGAHTGLHSISGIFYPSSCRASGSGWALAVSRIGAIGGPVMVGVMLAMRVPLSTIFFISAVPSLVFAMTVFVLGLFHRQLKREEAAFDARSGALSAGIPARRFQDA
jgi:MFS transporter, AAHS family, 4-hydroxybenzoate transporter